MKKRVRSHIAMGDDKMNLRRWILVANQAGAQIFQWTVRDKEMSLVEKIASPKGRLKSSQMGSDKPGRVFDRKGGSPGGHSMETQVNPHEHVAEQFAKALGTRLSKASRQFHELMLVAEPRFLGRIRKHLRGSINAKVVAEIEKDLGWLKGAQLKARVEKIASRQKSLE